ncbi:UbiX family flavin prenyltransferase [Roseibium salinum]|uniref:Flavin prenyltransferase UbiX n=1 Tax=Roseibium salinum TaxID=1604349 RepID=A0ABT3R603_9HYPH|nr:UbiX family flavin prenyltransferase [Roseibium sp. DSM 29163]MCX2724680.1 UbiX family flavin prenyltransferase [Roseibium sp. DSM 29163]
MKPVRRVTVGISGASGAAIAVELLRMLATLGIDRYVIVSQGAERTIGLELGVAARCEIRGLATTEFDHADLAAPVASGSFAVDAMIVAPCSMRSLATIAYGTGEGLLARAADVTLKERRPLVLVAREAPLHEGHLEAMLKVTRMGAIVSPPVPPFYCGLQSLDDMIHQIAARALATAGIDPGDFLRRWEGSD